MNTPRIKEQDYTFRLNKKPLVHTDVDPSENAWEDPTLTPEQAVRKALIEQLFLHESQDDTFTQNSSDPPPAKTDSRDIVELSIQAVALSHTSTATLNLTTDDGGTITITASHTETTAVAVTSSPGTSPSPAQADPLVLDLDGDGIELTNANTDGGVSFDLTADGVTDQVSWVNKDDGFLVLDRNNNGEIDNGGELFGDQHGAPDGFSELAKFDSDRNGLINREDAVYSRLRVWQDLNQDGNSSDNEMHSLNDLGIVSIDTGKITNRNAVINGNRLAATAAYSVSRKPSGTIADVWLSVRA